MQGKPKESKGKEARANPIRVGSFFGKETSEREMTTRVGKSKRVSEPLFSLSLSLWMFLSDRYMTFPYVASCRKEWKTEPEPEQERKRERERRAEKELYALCTIFCRTDGSSRMENWEKASPQFSRSFPWLNNWAKPSQANEWVSEWKSEPKIYTVDSTLHFHSFWSRYNKVQYSREFLYSRFKLHCLLSTF